MLTVEKRPKVLIIRPETEEFIQLYNALKGVAFNKNEELLSVLEFRTPSSISEILKRRSNISIDKLQKFKAKFITDKAINPRLEATPLFLASGPDDDPSGPRFEVLEGGLIRMRIKLIPSKAYAGYLRGFGDPEFYEDFKTISIDVDKEYRGHYLGFEVTGDSMITTDPDLFDGMALPGWKAVGRELSRHHWNYKLHTHKTDTWVIVHKTEGILIKNIVNHDVDQGTITIHSLNEKYPDEVLYLDDIAQIFNVVKFIIDK